MSRSQDKPNPPEPAPAAVRAVVSGRVQGVGFRYFVLREAHRLGLAGWTRNTDEGAVEVYAVGQRETLKDLVDALERGPAFARVDGVRVNWNVPAEPADEF